MRTLAALFAAFALALGPSTVVLAQTAPAASSPFADPASCPTMAEVEAVLTKQHETFVVIDVQSLLNVAPKKATHVLVSTFGKYAVFGYETPEGCLNGPTPIAERADKVGV
jgi:hypothetical protein